MEEIFVSSRNAEHMPHLFGHEAVGVIEQVGQGVITKKIGDICVIHWRKSSIGLDSEPGAYFSKGARIKSGKVVTFSTNVVVPENRVSPLPREVPPHYGVLLGCSLTTGWGSVLKVGEFLPGESILIIGLGAVGVFAALTAKKMGARLVTGVDRKISTGQKSERIGLSRFHPSLEEYLTQNRPEDGHRAPDLVIDTSGDPKVIEEIISWLPTSSRLVLVGMPRGKVNPKIDIQKMLDGLKLAGSNGGGVDPGIDLQAASGLLIEIRRAESPLEIKVMAADSLARAVKDFQTQGLLRFVLQMNSFPDYPHLPQQRSR